jgi:hypothetical protein
MFTPKNDSICNIFDYNLIFWKNLKVIRKQLKCPTRGEKLAATRGSSSNAS